MTDSNVIVRLAKKPEPGLLQADTFDFAEEPLPRIDDGEILVKSLTAAVDAGSRAALDDRSPYVIKAKVGGRVHTSTLLGRVVESKSDDFPTGSYVRALMVPRQTYLRMRPTRDSIDLIRPGSRPLESYAGVLGSTGLTAWVGIFDIAQVRPGDTVLISAAAGAVGMAAGQFARAVGARTVGIAGGPDKCAFVKDQLHFDECVDYKAGTDLREALTKACPEGVDVYFENVGGDIQRVALDVLNKFGRVAMCGQIAQYSGQGELPGPNLMSVVLKQLRLEGYLVTDHLDELPRFERAVTSWIDDGTVRHHATVTPRLEDLHLAINSLTSGHNIGQQLHRMAAE